MSEVSVYLLSIVGVVFLSVFIDIVLPNGNINKYIKSVMSLIVVFVLISPLPKLFKNGVDFSYENESDFNQGFSDTIKQQQIKFLETSLTKFLEEEGFCGVALNIWGEIESGALKITYIFVETNNLVLSTDNQHINKYKAITDLLTQKTGIRAEQVVFND